MKSDRPRDAATVFLRSVVDGSDGWRELGQPVSIVFRIAEDDGTTMTPTGVCPQCCAVPLNGEPYVCDHGVALPRALPFAR